MLTKKLKQATALSILSAAVISAGMAQAEARPIKLRLTSALSPNHGLYEGFYKPWMDLVEEKSDGRVVFQAFPAGEIVEGGKEPEALRQGVVDIAAPLLPAYDPARFPMSEVTMLPLVHSDALIAANAWKCTMDSKEVIRDGKTFSQFEYERRKIVPIAPPISAEYLISTTGKAVEKTEDFSDITLRTASRTHQIFADKVGLNTVSMPTFDLFDAMSRKTVDGSLLFVADWTAYGFQNMLKWTLDDANFGHFPSVLAISERSWKKIPKDIQKIMMDAADEIRTPASEIWLERDKNIRADAESKGAKFVSIKTLDQDLQNDIATAQVDTWKKFIEVLDKQGYPGKKVSLIWRDCVVAAGGEVPAEIKAM